MIEKEGIFYNLTHPQKRIWYIDKINLGSQLHNIGGYLNINGEIDIYKMKETLNLIIKNNEGLRLRFSEYNGQPIQYIQRYEKEKIDFIDFSIYEKPKEEFEKWVQKLFEKNFEIEDKKLYYFAIFKISKMSYGVLLKTHHIISDGWSIGVIEKQMCEIYSGLIRDEQGCFDEYCSYIDFIKDEDEYLRSERFVKNKSFWKEKFSDIPEDFLYKTSSSLDGRRQCFNISNHLSNKIKMLIDKKKCSLNTFFIAVLLIYINKTIHKKDIVIGTPVFNRTGIKQKSMVGMFTSTMPFRFGLDMESSIVDLLELINRELKLCFSNQKYPYNLLVKDLELNKIGYDSLFKMCVNYYNSRLINDINGIKVQAKEYYCGNQSYSLQLTIKEWEKNDIELNFDYKTLEYTEQEIKSMYESMINIVNQIIVDENIVIKDIKIFNEYEINHKLYELNSTSRFYSRKTVCELFEEQVIRTPNKIALEFMERTLTYEELNKKSNQLANYLKNKGIGGRTIIAIIQTHSVELVISILAVLKAGGVYLPIDPSYPIGRINYMLKDSESSMLLTNFKVNEDIKYNGVITNLEEIDVTSYGKENLIKTNELSDLVYIIYTSGSTGKPKGVMIEHQGLTNYILWAKKMYLGENEKEAMPLYSSISFDLTITSIFTPLISGNKVVIYNSDDSEFVLYRILKEDKVTVVKLTPAHLSLLKDMNNSNSHIKKLIVGGEVLKVKLAKEVYNSFEKTIEIYNEYGPTEAVVGCMIYKYDEEKDIDDSVPIGYPIDNVQIYILDSELNIVPTGMIGEIYVSGDCVARGYINREETTRERFIESPFIKGRRMYKTGDTARYMESGTIEYVGRNDNQVKIRGHRIEIGEIERCLVENECVEDTIVTFNDDASGNKVLNAYIVKKVDVTDLELRNWLLKYLPRYMIPVNFIFLERIPLTINGKIDYASLTNAIPIKKKFIKSRNVIEETVVEVMEEVLGVEKIGMEDNYYQIGGDSIKAIQISSKLRGMNLNIMVKDILTYDTVGEIAASVEKSQCFKTICQEKSQGFIEKTPIIEWFFNQEFINYNIYNQYILIEYNGVLDINRVIVAINELVEHHDGLRINYDQKNDKLFYNNKNSGKCMPFRYLDFSQYSYDAQCKNIKRVIYETSINFDIENNLLFNATIFNLGDGRQTLLFMAHHLVVDGISWRIILDDFLTILKQLYNDEEIKLPMKTHSFKEWSETLHEYSKKDFREEIDYWQSVLDKSTEYPVDFNNEKSTIKTSNYVTQELDKDTLVELVKKMDEIYSIGLNEVLIIALVITIKNLTGKNDVIVELERHGREVINGNIDVSRTVGWFTCMYPTYFKINNCGLDNNIKSLKEQLRSIPKKGFNYGILKFINKELKESEYKYIRFNYLGDFDNVINKEKLDVTNIEFGLESDKENPLTALIDISAVVLNGRLKVNAVYSDMIFKEETIYKFMECYIDTMKLILDKCKSKDSREFTPSDFDAVEISQEDLEALFNEN